MKIAVEGCAHGDLDNIYATLQHMESVENIKIDLLICCGDFQAVRNEQDLESLACPVKYRDMNTFWKYYSGVETAPYPTIFIGGNHEASNYLWELFYGGWAAPNIYFLGFAGVVKFGGVRIGGLSGIFKGHDYRTGHFEKPPYNSSDIRSVYHVREYDVQKLLHVSEPLDIFLSHDWPRGIAAHGDKDRLFRDKPYFRQEIESNVLGSRPGEQILKKLQPSYWFAAHLHVRFAAAVPHGGGRFTRFLALDKCLPRRNFLQVIEFPDGPGPPKFEYDEEWLAITHAFNPFLSLQKASLSLPIGRLDVAGSREWVKKRLQERGADIPADFKQTVPCFEPARNRSGGGNFGANGHVRNPHTEAFLDLLDLPYSLDHSNPPTPSPAITLSPHPRMQPSPGALPCRNPEEIPLDDAEEDHGNGLSNPEEILLDDPHDEDDEDDTLPDDVDELEAATEGGRREDGANGQ